MQRQTASEYVQASIVPRTFVMYAQNICRRPKFGSCSSTLFVPLRNQTSFRLQRAPTESCVSISTSKATSVSPVVKRVKSDNGRRISSQAFSVGIYRFDCRRIPVSRTTGASSPRPHSHQERSCTGLGLPGSRTCH